MANLFKTEAVQKPIELKLGRAPAPAEAALAKDVIVHNLKFNSVERTLSGRINFYKVTTKMDLEAIQEFLSSITEKFQQS